MGEHRLAGYISETEAYEGEEDLACHARAGKTKRTMIMYGPPGRAYVYFTYGMHWMLNCVSGAEGQPAAVLIRAITPCEGEDRIAAHREGQPRKEWCNGPAKLCQALKIDGSMNGAELYSENDGIWIETGKVVHDEWITTTPRIGINSVPEPWRSIPWRYRVMQLT